MSISGLPHLIAGESSYTANRKKHPVESLDGMSRDQFARHAGERAHGAPWRPSSWVAHQEASPRAYARHPRSIRRQTLGSCAPPAASPPALGNAAMKSGAGVAAHTRPAPLTAQGSGPAHVAGGRVTRWPAHLHQAAGGGAPRSSGCNRTAQIKLS